MSFSLYLLFEFLLSFHHQFPYFFHIEVWNFHFCTICTDLLNLIREENGKLGTIHILIAILRIIIKIVLINLLYELSLHLIEIN